MKKTIYIIRHGQTDMNKMGIIQGSGVDSSLNDKGRWQAQAFYEHYKDLHFEVALTSKLVRTHQTLAPFIENGINWEQFSEINEMNWGIYEGKKGDEKMRKDYLKMIKEWDAENFDYRLEGGESAAELSSRTKRFVDHLKTRQEQLILVCSHGRAMRCLLCHLKGQHLREMETYKNANTGLYRVVFEDGRFRVETENDREHLTTGEQNQV